MSKLSRRAVLASIAVLGAATALPILRASAPAPTAAEPEFFAEYWRMFSALTNAEKLRYAALLRGADPRFGELSDYIEATYGYGPVKGVRGKQA